MNKEEFDDIRDEYDDMGEDAQKDKYLTFMIADEDYGVEIRHVREIVGLQKITAIPDMPDFVRGVINLRGNVIPVMDVRLRFRLPSREYDERTCVIVADIRDVQVGLIVDTVNEVADIPEKNVEPPPKISRGPGSRYILGMGKIGDEVKILLDIQKLLFEEELDALVKQ